MLRRLILWVILLSFSIGAQVQVLMSSKTGHQGSAFSKLRDYFILHEGIRIEEHDQGRCPKAWVILDAEMVPHLGRCSDSIPVFSAFIPNPQRVMPKHRVGGVDIELPGAVTYSWVSSKVQGRQDFKDLVLYSTLDMVDTSGLSILERVLGVKTTYVMSSGCSPNNKLECFHEALEDKDPRATIIMVPMNRSFYHSAKEPLFREFWMGRVWKERWLVVTSSPEFYATGIPSILITQDPDLVVDELASQIESYLNGNGVDPKLSVVTGALTVINRGRSLEIGIQILDGR